MSTQQLYIYRWGTNVKQRAMKGRICQVRRRGAMNSCMIEFTDNSQTEIVSRNALKRERK